MGKKCEATMITKGTDELCRHQMVEVCTKMGNPVVNGEVSMVTSNGIVVNEGFYPSHLYLFSVDEPERVDVPYQDLTCSSDRSVAEKLSRLGESDLVFEVEKLDKSANPDKEKNPDDESDDEKDDDEQDDDKDDSKEKKKSKKKKDDEKIPVANPDSSVDVDSLPEDIKKSVISTIQMDEDQLNSVLSEMGDALMKGLKRVNVREPDVYSVVSDVQKAAYDIMTTKPAKKKG